MKKYILFAVVSLSLFLGACDSTSDKTTVKADTSKEDTQVVNDESANNDNQKNKQDNSTNKQDDEKKLDVRVERETTTNKTDEVKSVFDVVKIDKGYDVNPEISQGYFLVSKIEQDDKILTGYMDMKGDVLNDTFYEVANKFTNDLAFVKTVQGEGYYINTKGEKIIDKVDGQDIVQGEMFFDGEAKVVLASENDDEKFVYIDNTGKIVTEPVKPVKNIRLYKAVSETEYTVYGKLNKQGEETAGVGIYNLLKNQPQTEIIYDSMGNILNNRALAVKNDKLFLIDINGKVVKDLSKEYAGLETMDLNFLAPQGVPLNFVDGNAVIIDLDGNLIKKTTFKKLYRIQNGFMVFAENDKFGIADMAGNIVREPVYNFCSNIYKGNVLLETSDGWIIDKIVNNSKVTE